MLTKDENDALVKATEDITQALRSMAAALNPCAEVVFHFEFDEQPVVRLSHKRIQKMNPADRAAYLWDRSKIRSKHK